MQYPPYMQFWSLWSIWFNGLTLLQAISELIAHMACPHYMQLQSLQYICPVTIICNSGIYGGISHAFTRYKVFAYDAYVMPSTITTHCFILLCITLYYFAMGHALRLLACYSLNPVAYKTCTMTSSYMVLVLEKASAIPSCYAVLELARHMPCHNYLQFLSLRSICHTLIICSSGACKASAMQSLYAVLEPTGHTLCHHCIQLCNIWGTCYNLIKSNF